MTRAATVLGEPIAEGDIPAPAWFLERSAQPFDQSLVLGCRKSFLQDIQHRSQIFCDRRCLRAPFLADFFELCHGKVLEAPGDALEYARVAVELADRTGEPCRFHRAQGVRVHALVAVGRHRDAARVLEDYRLAALGCCPACASDYHLRRADLMIEGFVPTDAGRDLDHSLQELGPGATAHQRAKRCFIRGILHHCQRSPGRALDDAGTVLRDLDLEAPLGYFLDTLAFIACFLQRTDEQAHYQQALTMLQEFRRRLHGVDRFTAVRTRLAWVEGQVCARLRDWRRAHDCLGKVQRDLAGTDRDHHVLAVGLDRCQLYAGRPNDATRREILRTLKYYKTVLDLEPVLEKRLDKTLEVVSSRPPYTLQVLTSLRQSYIVPVPGIVVSR